MLQVCKLLPAELSLSHLAFEVVHHELLASLRGFVDVQLPVVEPSAPPCRPVPTFFAAAFRLLLGILLLTCVGVFRDQHCVHRFLFFVGVSQLLAFDALQVAQGPRISLAVNAPTVAAARLFRVPMLPQSGRHVVQEDAGNAHPVELLHHPVPAITVLAWERGHTGHRWGGQDGAPIRDALVGVQDGGERRLRQPCRGKGVQF
mmetsp:Transcript_27493/g.64107  ORF Transcript_27493/g.64107 Transcript_27493/m.64107 type:complete len:203 (+) Transcript_27493:375-983(+)